MVENEDSRSEGRVHDIAIKLREKGNDVIKCKVRFDNKRVRREMDNAMEVVCGHLRVMVDNAIKRNETDLGVIQYVGITRLRVDDVERQCHDLY